MAHEDGMSGSSKPMTDTKLFKMAFSSEQRDLKKRDAQIAALKAEHGDGWPERWLQQRGIGNAAALLLNR